MTFLFLTKRIDRFLVGLPDDWGDGYDNVRIGCTVENQETADYRLPLYISYPIKHRFIVCGPLRGTGSHFKKAGVVHIINPYKQKSVARELGISTNYNIDYDK